MSPAPRRSKHQLRVSSYDKVSTWIVSMLIVTCVTVGALFMVFVTQQLKLAEFAVPVTPVAMSGGGGAGGDPNHPEDSADVTPGSEETTAFDEPQFQETLTALASAVNSRTSDL